MDLASVLAALSAAGGASGMPGVDEPLDDDTISQIMADGYQGGKKPPSQLTLQEDVIDVTVSASRLARCSACPICCDPFKVGDDARELPCGHFFDDHCIVTWLEDNHTCPMCRYELNTVNDAADEAKRFEQRMRQRSEAREHDSLRGDASLMFM
mmetsp:Transcript_48570/g.122235  ORF Transcript_48570/g.122235 Transcript_48570/m.122235 type:complete len:154 (+) Transcript_48570:55-516(+)|eukprot:CAMPEP_0177650382 /NCGR_PEP_ID=MMETSP0447-20121125/11912_1 /TAXON_ID=0 /ORGANISM="Stygamoeba regulata, Strain BSH-02190019" /LENGTH=153 /DNA_ID=CAMNT_0019153247 /DNA_START=9 /DNA_END=470 /DNA_ORIENTATION=+